MRLSKKYEEYLEAQTHWKKITLEGRRWTLMRFPPLSKLNAAWFRKRMKKVAPHTVRNEMVLAKSVLKHFEMDTTELDNVKLPRVGESVTIEDLYTREELEAIWKHCYETRDKAMFKVLYESACRAGELLSMTHDNLVFEKDGTAKIVVKGKTGTRQVPIFRSVPALKDWLNAHPTGKGPIWVSLRSPHKVIRYGSLYARIEKILKRAGILRDTKRLLHMFRHTRITELVRLGVRGQSLSKLVGWTKRSNMESVYVHLSTADVENEIRSKVFGLEPNGDTHRPLLDSKKCPKCNTDNDEQTRICTNCNFPLTDDTILRAIQREETVDDLKLERVHLEQRIEKLESIVQMLYDSLEEKEVR